MVFPSSLGECVSECRSELSWIGDEYPNNRLGTVVTPGLSSCIYTQSYDCREEPLGQVFLIKKSVV